MSGTWLWHAERADAILISDPAIYQGHRAAHREHDMSTHETSRQYVGVLSGLACALCGLAANLVLVACYPPQSERISCDDALPPEQASFSRLAALALDPLKGCAADGCHSSYAPQRGLQLDKSTLIYEEFASNADVVYAMIASGKMPEDGVRWDDDDLRLFRSWYCDGAFPP